MLLRQYESVGRGTYDQPHDERDQAIGKAARMVAADIVGQRAYEYKALVTPKEDSCKLALKKIGKCNYTT